MSDNELESNMQMDESNLFKHIAVIIENRKESIASRANCEVTLMYWEVGHYINTTILEGDRAKYGKKIIAKLAEQLQTKYGNSFDYANIRRMIQLAERFPDFEILVPLARELSWSHFIALLPIKSDDAFMYYANDAICRKLGKRELRNQISRKSYERREIANMELSEQTAVTMAEYGAEIYWASNNYYLIGSHDNHDGLTHYRLDRILNLRISEEYAIDG